MSQYHLLNDYMFKEVFILKKLLVLVVILMLTACNSSENIQNNSIEVSHESSMEENKLEEVNLVKTEPEEKDYYFLALDFNDDNNPYPHELFERENILNDLKDMNQVLKDDFDYLELCEQPIYLKGEFILDKNFADYEENINEEVDGELFTSIKALQLGESLALNENLLISEGRSLTKEDFDITSENQEISILLGSKYKDYYEIGSVLNANLHQKDIDLKVVGFVEEGVSLRQNGRDTNFDDFIIMPFYNINYEPTDTSDAYYQKIWYTQKIEGLYSKNENDVDEKINQLNESYNMFLKPIESETTLEIVD